MGRECQAPHWHLLEVGNRRRPRVAVCGFLSSQEPRRQLCVPARPAWRGTGGEARGEASPQGRDVLHCVPVQVSVETFSRRPRLLHLGNPCAPKSAQRNPSPGSTWRDGAGRGGAAGRGLLGAWPEALEAPGAWSEPAPLGLPAGWALPLPAPRPGSSEGAGCGAGTSPRPVGLRQGLTRRRKVVP